MKKEYQKPVAACMNLDKGETLSNSPEYEQKICHQEWVKYMEKYGVEHLAERLPEEIRGEAKSEMSGNEKFRANPEFIYREIAGESILIPNGKMARQFNGLASLNKTGVFLWKLLEQERTLKQLSEAFAEEYELTEEQSMEDVTAFLKLALTRDLVIQS